LRTSVRIETEYTRKKNQTAVHSTHHKWTPKKYNSTSVATVLPNLCKYRGNSTHQLQSTSSPTTTSSSTTTTSDSTTTTSAAISSPTNTLNFYDTVGCSGDIIQSSNGYGWFKSNLFYPVFSLKVQFPPSLLFNFIPILRVMEILIAKQSFLPTHVPYITSKIIPCFFHSVFIDCNLIA
jgi:hypothetical protein